MRTNTSAFGMVQNYLESVKSLGLLEAHYCITLCSASIKPQPSIDQVALDWERGEDYSSGLALR